MKSKHHKTKYFIEKKLFSGLACFAELERRISSLPKEQRGDAFEVFAEAYLKTQPLHQARTVWPDNAIPQEIRIQLGLPSTDKGIDGIIETINGECHAYQVKYRTNRLGLSWDELSTFMGLSDKSDKRILFTNTNDLSSVMNDRTAFYSIKGNDLDALTQENFLTMENWLKTGAIKHKKKFPYPHQNEAINDILKELNSNDRTTAVMACGTGKTLVSLWVAEKIKAQAILVLLPSLALVRQTLHDWAKENSWNPFNFLCVCSDRTVAKQNDEIILAQHELNFPVTNQQKEIAQFLKSKKFSHKIIFSTYHSCPIIAEAMTKNSSFDFAIFDEAHKTASRLGTKHAFALENENLSIKKRLFLTATPRHYNVEKKNKEGNQKLVYSMDNEKTYGHIAYHLSFRKAVTIGLICNYKIIISIVDSNMINRELLKKGEVVIKGDIIKAERIANILATQNTIKQYGIKKIFSFHNSVRAAESFTAKGNEGIGTHLKNLTSLHVNGKMPTSKRECILKEFKEAGAAILSNARCLTEGVNIPVVDMVAFICPKKSKVDIVQAAGRAMRTSPNKTYGYILIPIFLEQVNGESIKQALEKTKFDIVWNVLQAMKEQDEDLAEIINQMKEDKGRDLGCNDNRLREMVEVLGPEICIDDLRKSIHTSIIEKLGSNWNEKFGELCKFKDENGHCNVPRNYPNNPSLATWIFTQRTRHKKGHILNHQKEKLESIGFIWEDLKAQFMIKYNYLLEFRKSYPNRWPKQKEEFPKGIKLGSFCANKRSNKKNLEQWKIDLLDKIDFPWNKHDNFFESRYKYLISFRKSNPNRWPEYNEEFPKGVKLGIWCDSLRQRHKNKSLKPSQIKELNEINFPWDLKEFYWNQQYEYLILFRKKKPSRWPKDKEEFPENNPFNLGIWCGTQKDVFEKEILQDWQIEKLKKIKFPFKRNLKEKQKTDWFKQYDHLLNFRKINPYRWPTNNEQFPNKNNLGYWCKKQKRDYKIKKLESWKIKELNKINFPWNGSKEEQKKRDTNWLNKYKCLLRFRELHPNRWPKREEIFENISLGKWCYDKQYRKHNLSKWRIKKLNEIKFPWK